MKRLCLVVLVAAVFCCTALAGTGEEATKAAAAFKTSATVIPANDGRWHTVLTTTIKNPTADDDLFIDVSQVNRITTINSTSSATPGAISTGDARLLMRVLVDGFICHPGPIVFDEQLMQLTSNLQRFQSLSCSLITVPNVIVTTSCVCSEIFPVLVPQAIACAPPPAPVPFPFLFRTCARATASDPDLVTVCRLVPGANETLASLLSETIAHSYDFFCQGVGGMGDTHIVQVQENLAQFSTPGAFAQALIGPQDVKVLAVDLKPAQ